MCHAVWRNMTHCSESSGLCVCVCNNNCLPSPPYHGRKVGYDLEGVPSNAVDVQTRLERRRRGR